MRYNGQKKSRWSAGSCIKVWILAGLCFGVTFLLVRSPSTYLSTDKSGFLSEMLNNDNDNGTIAFSNTNTIPDNTSSPVEAVVASNSAKQQPSLDGSLLGIRVYAESTWSDLISEASNLKSAQQVEDPGAFMEVGMFRAKQCLEVATAGLKAHCVEPSATNFNRVKDRIHKVPNDVQRRIQLHHVAAGSVTGRKLEFHSGGGSGDRVGHVDVWKMNPNPTTPAVAMTEVQEMRMDDIVMKEPQGIFMMKIDTQGFEPYVFLGLNHTLQSHKAKFILLEYWPKGIDLMTAKIGDCSSPQVLRQLLNSGYKLYQLPVSAHPKAPKGWRSANDLPLDDLEKNCRWYYDMESRFPSEEYRMGYWSDILAVAPEVRLAQPVSKLGKLLYAS